VLELEEGIDRFAAHVLELGVTPACAVAVTDRDGTVYEQTYGGAEPGELWQIGSIGKSFTALVTLQLVDEGVLDLHAPVADYLPWFSVQGMYAPITLHHLLTHTAGLIMGSEIAPASTYDVIALRHTEAGHAPGDHFWYSNVGYRTIGVVLERVTGRTYAELVEERIFAPLGMEASAASIMHDTRTRLVPGFVPFFDDRPFRTQDGLVPATWVESAEADGCICCSVGDLATYLRAFMRGCEGILSAEGFRLMTTPHTRDELEDERYGYGLVIGDRALGHTGSMIGHRAAMWADLGAGVGVATAVNGPTGAAALRDAALAVAAEREPEPFGYTPPERLADDRSAPHELAGLIGHYRSHNPWFSNFRIAARDGVLWLASEGIEAEHHPLTALAEGTFRVGKEPWIPERIRFDTFIDGTAQRAVYSGNPYYRTFTP
jgi:CubicO group peptidase (beta-lactamase class C family)